MFLNLGLDSASQINYCIYKEEPRGSFDDLALEVAAGDSRELDREGERQRHHDSMAFVCFLPTPAQVRSDCCTKHQAIAFSRFFLLFYSLLVEMERNGALL